MKKLFLILMFCSFGCLAQQTEKGNLEAMHLNMSAGRMFCSFTANALGKSSPELKKCRDDLIDKSNVEFVASKGRLEKNPAAVAALKNYYAAALAAMEQVGTVDKRTEDQAALRVQELFNLLKLELLGS